MEKFSEEKRVLVTGGSGQVGLELKRLSEGQDPRIKFFFPESNIFDLSDKDNLSDYYERVIPDLIVNLGAYTTVDLAETNKDAASLVNHDAVKFLAERTSTDNVGVIHFSTDYVFGNSKGPFKPKDKKNPINHYGFTKSLGEDSLLKYNQDSLIIRLSSVFSVTGKNFVKTMINLLCKGKEVRVVSDQKISLTYAGDVAEFILYLLRLYLKNQSFESIENNILHFTNKGFTDWFSVAKLINNEIKDSHKISIKNKIVDINSKDWVSEAERPLDSRLYVDYKWYENRGIFIPSWQERVKRVVSLTLPETLKELENEYSK